MWWKMALGLSFVLFASLWPLEGAGESPKKLYEMEVLGVAADPGSGQPVVHLRGKQDKRELSMFIGQFEAMSIAVPLQGLKPPRPLTHDLMLELLHTLKASLKRVVINDLRGNTYYATLHLEAGGTEHLVDSRPSDAIALALRANVPILAEERAFARSLLMRWER